jgi:hypothetical protein
MDFKWTFNSARKWGYQTRKDLIPRDILEVEYSAETDLAGSKSQNQIQRGLIPLGIRSSGVSVSESDLAGSDTSRNQI